MAKEKAPLIEKPREVRPGFRDAEDVDSVVLRMGIGYIDALDELCDINFRSRREIVEALIHKAYQELAANNGTRIEMV